MAHQKTLPRTITTTKKQYPSKTCSNHRSSALLTWNRSLGTGLRVTKVTFWALIRTRKRIEFMWVGPFLSSLVLIVTCFLEERWSRHLVSSYENKCTKVMGGHKPFGLMSLRRQRMLIFNGLGKIGSGKTREWGNKSKQGGCEQVRSVISLRRCIKLNLVQGNDNVIHNLNINGAASDSVIRL